MNSLSNSLSDRELQASFKELQRENENLLEMLDQYRLMFDQSLDAVILFDAETCFKEVNQAACHLFELPKDKLIGQSLHKFLAEDQCTK